MILPAKTASFAFAVVLSTLSETARAQAPTSDPPPELGAPPPPPAGASLVLEPDDPSTPASEPPPRPPRPPTPSRGLPESDESSTLAPTKPEPASIDDGVAPAEPQSQWYGWKLLIADGGSLSLALAEPPVRLFGQTAYVVAGPAIHLGHKQGLAALGSLALRLGAPLALNALIGARCSGLEPCFPTGWFVGALAASAIDDLALARRTIEAPRKTLVVAPSVVATRDGALVSVGGTF